ncbi:hypothetical protein BO94DRAFT_609957 [Aspergillus sclerotioniger CBS 115572]|uniref:Arrestin C-terminal-like domain-containing protein n=1 Tax=Aspergillus sclerotioniger CBS 115572 TaxID=1450535 RepID=A0A317XA89_9EURO|nr:hypothetical protein BO94DRAFT_609957 [Aspergillus sclerotioniger CBS 115572]PWY94562.1 hypothetical protein BO94DRAFT_609957 [Aspergillus sclerotioniger CBS 115572]
MLKQSIQQSLRVFFCPIISSQPPQAIAEHRAVIFSSYNGGTITTYQVTIELSQGACLSPGLHVPINVYITRTGPANDSLVLNDYQIMLIEETVMLVRGFPQIQRRSRILRTVSNLDQTIYFPETPMGTTMSLSDDLWGGQSLPSNITPDSETCNIRRSYKLEIRLGFNSGPEKVQTRILEIHFPINIIATAFSHYLPTILSISEETQANLAGGVFWENMKH